MMVKMGDANGMVSGHASTARYRFVHAFKDPEKDKTGNKARIRILHMVVPNCDMGANGTFIFADAGLEQNPDPEKLANIAISSPDSFKLLVEKEPVVAMLSHSTKEVLSMQMWIKLLSSKDRSELAPELFLDGELQLDAAIVPSVGES